MEKLKQKLSSRKLWAGMLAVAASIVAMCMGESLTPEIVDALEVLTAACAAYIFGEGIVDAAREKNRVDFGGLIGTLDAAEKEEQAAEENQAEEI